MTASNCFLRKASRADPREGPLPVLFEEIDLTEVQRVAAERSQRLGRIDSGIHAVKSAAEKIRQTGVAIPETSPKPDEQISDLASPDGGEKLGTELLAGLERLDQLRSDVAAGEQLILQRQREITAAEKSRQLEIEKNIKNGMRFLGLFLLILFLKWCAGLFK